MGKKEEKIAKDLQKKCRKCVKNLGKEFNMKTISSSLYKKEGSFFFHSFVDVDYVDKEFILYGKVKVKPYLLDDVFWEVFDAEENKDAPDSLRVNGAYVAPSISVEFFKVVLSEEDNLEEQCRDFMAVYDEIIKSYLDNVSDIDSFISKHSEEIQEDVNKLMLVLLNILQDRYKDALIIVDNEIQLGNTGGFLADSKSIFEFAKEYCEERI